MNKPDLKYNQADRPYDNKCSSGHIASETFKIEGTDGIEGPTRFFEIYKDNKYLGCFCEPCLIVAKHLADLKRGKK